jgi:hypothetical protein
MEKQTLPLEYIKEQGRKNQSLKTIIKRRRGKTGKARLEVN